MDLRIYLQIVTALSSPTEGGDKIVDVGKVLKGAAELFADKVGFYVFFYVSEDGNATFVAGTDLSLGIGNYFYHFPDRIKGFL